MRFIRSNCPRVQSTQNAEEDSPHYEGPFWGIYVSSHFAWVAACCFKGFAFVEMDWGLRDPDDVGVEMNRDQVEVLLRGYYKGEPITKEETASRRKVVE